ncbi:long-chain fatty acid--CoA ligase [Glycomyces sp. TRM65418]|uniref:long-chain-fatty-acid--CoA ligase n=1 Tax=Glycomyces sp. TRM65418 TaxID=2867006 RepID=UPI001CE5703B|nr:long-chain fatty acid--CoA ligase [Glycomyces sp. TRM65418]MCC3765639.1 long-chain fatty acid--CoA ligase [Glycomyces sp. TRM65418]QZD55237.1 long-chain fatty acid--CoA ligase [Glycomyces sp. TRM65418]
MTHQHPARDEAIDGPGQGTLSVAAVLAETARRRPDAPAIYFMDQTITYGALWDQTRAYAGALAARGIGSGSRVAMLVPNVPDFPRVYYAALALGAVVVPIHLLFKTDEIRFVLEDADVDLLVAAAPLLAEAAPAAALAGVPLVTVLAPEGLEADGRPLPRLEAEAAAAEPIRRHAAVHPLAAVNILYTSGTTGTPKGAVGSHLAMVEQVHTWLLDACEYRPDDVLYGGLPFFHSFGQTVVLNAGFRRGAAIILLPRFDPDEALALLVRHRATVFAAVPTNYAALVEAAERAPDRPPLRCAISGGAALPTALLEAFEDVFGAQVHEGYGLTETSPVCTFNDLDEPIRPGTVGKPIWGVDVAVADPEVEGRIELIEEPGAPGEIVVRGHNLMKGYLGRPDATAAAVVDGWFRTGDLGTVDESGVVRIVDRKKDMIIRNGYNVYPTEVEAVLTRHPAVSIAAVFGVPHETHGQEVHAAVVPARGAQIDPAEVVAFMKAKVAAYKYPRVVHVVESLPLGPSGKILKRELVRLHGG